MSQKRRNASWSRRSVHCASRSRLRRPSATSAISGLLVSVEKSRRRELVRHRGCGSRPYFFHPALQHRALQENPAATTKTTDADVGAEAHDLPVARAAGMGLAQANDVTDGEVNDRSSP